MSSRYLIACLLASAVLASSAPAQDKPPAAAPAASPIAAVVEKEVKSLSSEEFPERQAALGRLQTLVAEQLKQRAQIQEILDTFTADLAKQQAALAMAGGSSDEEVQAQIAGLLEMERGLTGWTIQAVAAPLERRKALLNWGLTKETAPVLARAYSQNKRTRLQGVKELTKYEGEGADWTIARLINDSETAVRAAAMAACWNRKPSADIVNALWVRAVTGPLTNGGMGRIEPMMRADMEGMPDMIKVDFPGGDPMEFDAGDEANQFFDSQLAADVLVHLNSPLVAGRVRTLVADRIKEGKSLSLSSDPEWTLVSHRLIEAYAVKEAIPLLAAEALGVETDEMGGDMNGRPFMWSRRTMAIGSLCKLIGKDPADFDLMRARDMGDPRGWMWAVDINPEQMNGNFQADGAAVRAFYAFWKDHHAEYGVKEEPSNAGVPPVRGPGRGMMVPPIGPGGPRILPVRPVPEAAPDDIPGAAPTPLPNVAPDPAVDLPAAPRPRPAIRNGAAG